MTKAPQLNYIGPMGMKQSGHVEFLQFVCTTQQKYIYIFCSLFFEEWVVTQLFLVPPTTTMAWLILPFTKRET